MVGDVLLPAELDPEPVELVEPAEFVGVVLVLVVELVPAAAGGATDVIWLRL